jgi:hypothetical protein
MEQYTLDNDIRVFGIEAKAFPDGIVEAFDKLHSLLSDSKERNYFGISRPNEQGVIIYKASVEQLYEGEAKQYNCEIFTIKSGKYVGVIIKDYLKNESSIENAFKSLLTHPEIDPNGACVEWYINGTDVRCMVRLE